MLQNLFSKKSSSVVGLEFRGDGVSVVASKIIAGLQTITSVGIFEATDKSSVLNDVRRWVSENSLGNSPCNVVLAQGEYQLLLVEAPDVDEKELRSAIRWRLKDLINIPIDKAVLEVFKLPEDGGRANKKMVYVVATEAQKIKSLVELIRASGLMLESIDISELALRNVALQLVCDDVSERGIALARIQSKTGSVYIYKQGNMYLARTFSLEYNGGLMDELPQDALALELQRSLDYYERQMGQAPPSVVYICGDHVTEEKVGPTFRASIAVQLQVLDPSAVASLEGEVNAEDLKYALGALGATLRVKVGV